jgi:prepilin-type N-terminal cleavage/methylation domain-containing protein
MIRRQRGFSLLEVLIAMAIFAMFAASIFFVYGNLLEIMSRTRTRTLSSTLLNREIEMIRLLPYDSVGIQGGFPAGVIAQQRVEVYEGTQFLIKAYVRNTDNPFDGTTGGSPNDTAPADYKIVELEVSCALCYGIPPLTYTTWVAPQNLESASNNGSLFVNAFDADGLPIFEADVKVVNTNASPTITIIDQTNASGQLQLVDIPTSTNGYQITVSKQGYSTSVTYLPGGAANPNPSQPHVTVAAQQITEASFGIDRVSTITVKSQDEMCVAIPSVSMNQIGTKLIGSGPDVVKYSSSFTTNSTGDKVVHPLEWDSYKFTNTTAGYDIAGTIPLLPLTLDPYTSATLAFVMAPKSSSSLLVAVQDASGTPLTGATVRVTKTGVDVTKVTGQRFFTETDWSGGNYASTDGNLDVDSPAGEVTLSGAGSYPTSTNSYLVSNTIDLGTSEGVEFSELSWSPSSQPSNTTLKFQVAGNTDGATWNYVGPDGTGDTYFTTTTSTIGTALDSKRYVRYQAYFNTTNASNTPSLESLTMSFTSACVPQSQAFFDNLATGTYTVTVSKTGHTTASSSVSVGSGWQETVITMQ